MNKVIEIYKEYEIKETQDFGLRDEGKIGYMIIKGSCNVGPGGVYFMSVEDCRRGIDIFIQAGGGTDDYDNDLFWNLLQKRWAKYEICEDCGEMVYIDSLGKKCDDKTTATQKKLGMGKQLYEHKCKDISEVMISKKEVMKALDAAICHNNQALLFIGVDNQGEIMKDFVKTFQRCNEQINAIGVVVYFHACVHEFKHQINDEYPTVVSSLITLPLKIELEKIPGVKKAFKVFKHEHGVE